MTTEKKIIYIANIRLPTEKAHGLQIMKTCEALKKEGIDIELIVPRRRNHIADDPFKFYGIANNFKITKLWCWDLVSSNFFGALGFWLESLTFYFSVKRYIRGQSSDAVFYTRDLAIAYWLSRGAHTVYYEIHTLPERANVRYKKSWNQCKGLVVISDGLKNKLVAEGVRESKILVARDAVDVEQFTQSGDRRTQLDYQASLGLSKDKKNVVYTGHLYEWKGASILAEAAKHLSDQIQIYIVGGTVEDIEKFKETYHYPNLHIMGAYPHSSMPIWQRAADILVVPTSAKTEIGRAYTSPMKLFEYMMAGRALVVSDIQSLREILDESMAYFFKPDDPVSLANTLKIVAASDDEAECRAAKALSEVIKKYSWGSRANQMAGFIFSIGKND